MCAPNKAKKGNRAFSNLFRAYLATYLPWCQAALAPCQEWKFSSSSMNCMSMDSIIEVFCHLNKILIVTKHIVDNTIFCISLNSALAHLVCSIVQNSQLYFLPCCIECRVV